MNINRIFCQIVRAVNFREREERGRTKSSGYAEFKFCLFWLIKVYNLATATNVFQECVVPLWACKQSFCTPLSAQWWQDTLYSSKALQFSDTAAHAPCCRWGGSFLLWQALHTNHGISCTLCWGPAKHHHISQNKRSCRNTQRCSPTSS